MTSPDPEFNVDARDYFTRHMRVLEQCMSAWPMPEMEAQINALRVAFSANTEKPFELRRSFPYDSPSEGYESSPPLDAHYQHLQMPRSQPYQQHPGQLSYSAQTLTPPISSGPDSRTDTPLLQPAPGMISTSYGQVPTSLQLPPSVSMAEAVQWNPTPILEQWNAAFSIPPSALAPPSSSSNSPSTSLPLQPFPNQSISPTHHTSQPYTHHYQQTAVAPAPLPQQLHQQPQQQIPQTERTSYVQDLPIFVTPKDWQQSVASVFDAAGMKRRWDYGSVDADGHMQKRMR